MKYITQFSLIVVFCGFIIPLKGQESVKDLDGNVYKTVNVGNQVWMAENLKVTRYSNGDPIPDIKDQKQWNLMNSGACCDLNNDIACTKAFGLLYNWYTAADDRNVCPAGWHVASESEWIALVTFLAGEDKETVRTSGKLSPGIIQVNNIMFRVLPEGFRGFDGEFSGIGYGGGGWWSSTSAGQETAWYHNIDYNTAGRTRMEGRKKFGYNIRCIKQ
jgi:uncharacterized protein (TIGR02145 family)